jgi:peptide/nickel transport system permease protein
VVNYILRRILLAVPTALLISLAVFGLSKCAPYDPVYAIFGDNPGLSLDPVAAGAAYQTKIRQIGQDYPAFYFAVEPASFPDSLHRIYPPERRERLRMLTAHTGDWAAVDRYEKSLSALARALEQLPDSAAQKPQLRAEFKDLADSGQPRVLDSLLQIFDRSAAGTPLATSIAALRQQAAALRRPAANLRRYQPAFRWYGLQNQYHRWISGFFTGELGRTIYGKPVWEELRPRLYTTLVINGCALLLAFALALPLGVRMARLHNRPFDRFAGLALLFVHAIPVFWLGSLLLLFLATPGQGLALFKSTYLEIWNSKRMGFGYYLLYNAPKLVLPVLTIAIHALALLTLQMRSSMLGVLQADYIRTARAKGLPESAVYWRHAFPNAVFPIITIFSGVFPALFAGSLVIEYLFQTPGMGVKAQEAFVSRDYPVLFAILMIASFLTVLGNLLADLLYAWADPRVRFARK